MSVFWYFRRVFGLVFEGMRMAFKPQKVTLMKILKISIAIAIVMVSLKLTYDFASPKYCWKSKSSLNKDELYTSAMKSWLRKDLNSKKEYLNGWDYGRAHGELYNFWISSPVTKQVLANELEPFLDVDTINENFKSQFGHNVQVFDDSILLQKHESHFFQEGNNQFNLYWTVTPPYYLYLSDCCQIKTDIKSYNFLGFGFNQQTNYLVVKQTLPFTKRLDIEEKFPAIESKHLLNGCGEVINH